MCRSRRMRATCRPTHSSVPDCSLGCYCWLVGAPFCYGLNMQWCSQGVLLLNAALTVRAKSSNSHAGEDGGFYMSVFARVVVRTCLLLWPMTSLPHTRTPPHMSCHARTCRQGLGELHECCADGAGQAAQWHRLPAVGQVSTSTHSASGSHGGEGDVCLCCVLSMSSSACCDVCLRVTAELILMMHICHKPCHHAFDYNHQVCPGPLRQAGHEAAPRAQERAPLAPVGAQGEFACWQRRVGADPCSLSCWVQISQFCAAHQLCTVFAIRRASLAAVTSAPRTSCWSSLASRPLTGR